MSQVVDTELGMGRFSKPNPTRPKPLKLSPDPTKPITDMRHGKFITNKVSHHKQIARQHLCYKFLCQVGSMEDDLVKNSF